MPTAGSRRYCWVNEWVGGYYFVSIPSFFIAFSISLSISLCSFLSFRIALAAMLVRFFSLSLPVARVYNPVL